MGKGGRGFAVAVGALVIAAGLIAGNAEAADRKAVKHDPIRAFVTPPLLESAKANKSKVYRVIVQAEDGNDTRELIETIMSMTEGSSYEPAVVRRLNLIAGVSIRLTGSQILRLARKQHVLAITPDAPIELASYSNKQKWAYVSGIAKFWREMEAGLKAARDRDRRLGHPEGSRGLPPRPCPAGGRPHQAGRQLGWRRARPRHLRRGDRGGRGARLRRRAAGRPARLDRRHGRQGHGDDERRHRSR